MIFLKEPIKERQHLYSFSELFTIQDRLVKMFPDRKQEIYEIFRHPYGDVENKNIIKEN